jgi:hypothetical protein
MYSVWTQVDTHVKATAEEVLKKCYENPEIEEVELRNQVQQSHLELSTIPLGTLCPACFTGPETDRGCVCIDGNFQMRTMGGKAELFDRDTRDKRLFVERSAFNIDSEMPVDAQVLSPLKTLIEAD